MDIFSAIHQINKHGAETVLAFILSMVLLLW